jgi:hypothetical protein
VYDAKTMRDHHVYPATAGGVNGITVLQQAEGG